MNCAERMKQRRDRANRRFRRMFLAALLMGGVIGFLLGLTVKAMGKATPPAPEAPPVAGEGLAPILTPEPTVEPTATPEPALLGTYRITAYCSCEKCCGEWAKNRPNGVVYGAAGIELIAGVSAASPLPLGTVVEVEGLGEYVVQDRPAKWVIEKYGENQLDIYFDNHEEACAFGLQYLNVYIKEEPK